MKGFIDVSRAATCASVVILESCSPESVVAKRRDSVQKPYGMTSVWGGRTVNTSILSFPSVVVGNLSFPFLNKNGSPTETFGDDGTLRATNLDILLIEKPRRSRGFSLCLFLGCLYACFLNISVTRSKIPLQ